MKLRFSLMALLALGFVFAGCKKDDGGDTNTPPAATTPTVGATVGGVAFTSGTGMFDNLAGWGTTGSDSVFFAAGVNGDRRIQLNWPGPEYATGIKQPHPLNALVIYRPDTLLTYRSEGTSATLNITAWTGGDNGKVSGTYSGTVYNSADETDSLIITNGSFSNIPY